MNKIYTGIEILSVMAIIVGVIMAIYTKVSNREEETKKYLIIFMISMLVFGALTVAQKPIYINTKSGQKALMNRAKLYLNENLLDKKFEVTEIDDEGTVRYTVFNKNNETKKEIKYKQYWNGKTGDTEGSIWFLPIVS